MIISQDKNLAAIYSDLCIRARAIQKKDAAGETICANCTREKKRHVNDGRCDCYVTSMSFRCLELVELTAIENAMTLIEELRDIKA